MMVRDLLTYTLLTILGLTLIGCSSMNEVITESPEPVNRSQNEEPLDEPIPVVLTLQIEQGNLPSDVQELRFLVAGVHFYSANGTSVARRTFETLITLPASNDDRRVLVQTDLPAATYQEIGVDLVNPHLTFNANAGGPLTVDDDTPLRVALPKSIARADSAHRIDLKLQPSESLYRDENCHWHFKPSFTTSTKATPL